MNKPIIVIGAGGHGKVLVDTLKCSGATIIGITDNNTFLHGTSLLGVPVIGNDTVLSSYHPDKYVLANGIGSVNVPAKRKEIFERFKKLGYKFHTVIHPSATIASDVFIDEGSQIFAGAVIQTGAKVGANCIINTNATVDHDCTIADHVHISPGTVLSGGVEIGECTHVGVGAVVRQSLNIGKYCLIAAGAVVTDEVKNETTVMGIPARERKL